MRRGIAEARSELARLEPRLTDYQTRQYRDALASAERRAQQVVEARLADLEQQLRTLRDSALRELTDARDSYEQLTADAGDGRMPAGAYAQHLDTLARRQAQAEDALDRAEELVEQIEGIEADPIAFFDGQARRLPNMKVEVPW